MKSVKEEEDICFYSTQIMCIREYSYSLLEVAPKVLQVTKVVNSTEYECAEKVVQGIREVREGLLAYQVLEPSEEAEVQMVLNMMLQLLCYCHTLDSIVRRTWFNMRGGSKRGLKDIKHMLSLIFDVEQHCTKPNIPQIIRSLTPAFPKGRGKVDTNRLGKN